MKFLFTVASYYPVVGGVQMVTQNMAEELVKNGHDVTVLISRNNNIQEFPMHNGVKLEYWDLYTKKDRIVGDKNKYVCHLKDMCENVDVLVNVSVHSALTDALLPYIGDIKCCKVLYLHGIYEFGWSQKDKSSSGRIISKLYYNARRRKFYANLYRYAKHYDLIVHLDQNDSSMKYMEKYGVTQNIVIHNAAERAFFEPASTECNEKYFLQVANYAEHKNQEYSLRAFYQSNCPEMKMVYIGSQKNAYFEYLIQLNEKLKNEHGERNVEFLVGIDRQETIEKFKHAIAIVLSSRVEKFPMVLVEGMACGVPFISTDCGNVNSLPGGVIVHSINEMANQMKYFSRDTDNVKEMRKIGRQYAEKNFLLNKNVAYFIAQLKKE